MVGPYACRWSPHARYKYYALDPHWETNVPRELEVPIHTKYFQLSQPKRLLSALYCQHPGMTEKKKKSSLLGYVRGCMNLNNFGDWMARTREAGGAVDFPLLMGLKIVSYVLPHTLE
jgi:hypothetical protein